MVESKEQRPLAYVNIGIKEKNIGAISKEDGSFEINIAHEYQNDSLTFSLVGYKESNFLIRELVLDTTVLVRLKEKVVQLREVAVVGEKLVEKKYGIKKRGTIHFTDGIFKKDDSFEIGQVINLGSSPAQITSVNLHVNSSRPDSASFRINFYRYDADENTPKERIMEQSILQRHPIKEGWLKFDLAEYSILLKGSVLASIEFIPENKEDVKQIFYEVKLGGSSKSFFRRTSLGRWTRPPHHYCLYITATTSKEAPDEPDDTETLPTFTLKSDFSNEPFSLFVRLPKEYAKNPQRTYPVFYLLDGNVYFDPVAHYADKLTRKKRNTIDPILVGIGYENAYVMDSLRDRDYTFPRALPADGFKISGEGEKFYQFVKEKIVTHIDSAYRTDKVNRTIMGHSLGGYFVLHALTHHLSGQTIFTNFVAASPSIDYHTNYILDVIERLANKGENAERAGLFLTIGALEVLEDQPNGFKRLTEILAKKSIDTNAKVYKDWGHMETAIPTFEEAVRQVMHKNNSRKK
ncbi:putative alpha/beta superfamily hydrolase [Rhabdobacter roseus]|uniref:Putative alpha/beta superfamily hydrolase n=1 Tax=Rhabdobacter roseus TaxID=1655419 RepID=A0A840TQF2_9BACT|nr:putative alpha/beta superfamily hydrolase [Rhabdobacter roseus]